MSDELPRASSHESGEPSKAKPVTVIALSGGKDSTAMTLRLLETEPAGDYRLICTPTGNELPAVFDHLRALSDMVGLPIVPLMAETLAACIKRNGMIPNFRARFCTRQLKIEPFAAYLRKLRDEGHDVVTCVGIRADEPEREAGDYRADGATQRFPLREWGWGLRDVLTYLDAQGVDVPERTDCALCFFQRLGEWWALWRDHPDEYQKGVEIEQEMGYTFRSDGRDTWPASLEQLRARFVAGDIPQGAPVQGELFKGLQCRVCRL